MSPSLSSIVGAVIGAVSLVSAQSQPDCGREAILYEDPCWIGSGKIYAVRSSGNTWPYPASSFNPWANVLGCLREDGLLGNEADGCATFTASGLKLSSAAGDIGVLRQEGSGYQPDYLSAASSAVDPTLSTLATSNEWTGSMGTQFGYERKYIGYGLGYIDWSVDAAPGIGQSYKVYKAGGVAPIKTLLLFHGCQSVSNFYPDDVCDVAKPCAAC